MSLYVKKLILKDLPTGISWHLIVSFSYQYIHTSQSVNLHLWIQMSPCHGRDFTLHLLHINLLLLSVLGDIQFCVCHWFLFNELYWFVFIKSSLITMKVNVCVCVFVTVAPWERRCSLNRFWLSEQMDEEYLKLPRSTSYVSHFSYFFRL